MTAQVVPPCFINCDVAYLEARRRNSRETVERPTHASRKETLRGCAHASPRASRFARINSRATGAAMIECFVTGLLAWRDGQPGQVGNEAATAVFHQCRGSGSSPSSFLFVLLVQFSSCCFSCCFPRCLRVCLESGESARSALSLDTGLSRCVAWRRPVRLCLSASGSPSQVLRASPRALLTLGRRRYLPAWLHNIFLLVH